MLSEFDASRFLLKFSQFHCCDSYREDNIGHADLRVIKLVLHTKCAQNKQCEGCLLHPKLLLKLNKKLALLTFDHFSIINRAVSLRSFDCAGLHLRIPGMLE